MPSGAGRSDCIRAALSRADADRFLDAGDENLAVADAAGHRRVHDRLDRALDDLKATLDRSFADSMRSKDGVISPAAWDTAKSVVMGAGILKTDVKYDEIIDMSFVNGLKASL